MDIPARKFITILLLTAASLAAAFRTLPPPPLPADTPEALFSAGRAINHPGHHKQPAPGGLTGV